MKIQVNNYSLQDAIKKLSKVKNPSRYQPILDCVHIEAKNNIITMIRTDLNITVKTTITGFIQQEGELLLNSDTLKLLSKIKNDSITITDKQITAGGKTLKFSSFDLKDYPETNFNYEIEGFTTTEKNLFDLLSVKYAMSKEEGKPSLTGVTIDETNFMATDGHRMHCKHIDFENKIGHGVIIPADAANLLSDYLDKKSNNSVQCFVSDYREKDKKFFKIHFKFNNMEITSRLIDANIINYKQVIPHNFKTEVTINVKEVLEELAFVQDLAKTQEMNLITLAVMNDSLYIDAEGNNNGVTTEIDANIYGDKLEVIAVNHTYLIEALKQVNEDKVTIKFNTQYEPFIIEGALIVPINKRRRQKIK